MNDATRCIVLLGPLSALAFAQDAPKKIAQSEA
jgi:hypothetical protein